MPLIIKKEYSNPAVVFSSLSCGEIFLHKNELYIKAKVLPENADDYECGISLTEGKEKCIIDNETMVVPVNATLTYYVGGWN